MEATLAELRRRLVESQEVADELTIMPESRACSRSVQIHRHIEEAIEKVEARIEKLGHTLARLEGGDLGHGPGRSSDLRGFFAVPDYLDVW